MSAAIEACQPGNGGGETVGEEADGGSQAASAAWERFYPGGDCACSDGSEFSFWVREASTENVVLYLEDGGARASMPSPATLRGRLQRRRGGWPARRRRHVRLR